MTKYYLIWAEERHSIGIASIDSQHREIAERVNRIADEIVKGSCGDSIKGMLDDMMRFVGEHFAHEEELMSTHDYPEIGDHVEEHKRLIQQLRNIIGTGPHLPNKVALAPAFLIDWVERHTLSDDVKLGRFLGAKGLS